MEPLSAPSPLLAKQWERLGRAARRGPLVELACGRGRIALAAAAHGPVLGLDRNDAFLRELTSRAGADGLPVRTARADWERDPGLPLATGGCAAVLVFRYLHRPLAREIERVLAPGGLLLYETFTLRQRELGYGPSNEAFLLRDGELAQLFPGLETLYHWEGTSEEARPAAVARLVARKA